MMTRLASLIDRLVPEAGRAARVAMAEFKARTPRKTPHGFVLTGVPMMLAEDWEFEERTAFQRWARECDVVVDVGANAGYYTCLGRSIGKPVVAVEPLWVNLIYLYRNLELNGFLDVEVFPLGLSNKSGLVKIFGSNDVASLVPDWAGAKNFTLVPVSTLDHLLGSRFADARLLIKVDVEGHEREVLEGATETLARCPRPVWFVEVLLSDPSIPDGASPESFHAVFEAFWRAGYQAHTPRGAIVNSAQVDRWLGRTEAPGFMSFFFA
jgi:FkbM family methyltransferase